MQLNYLYVIGFIIPFCVDISSSSLQLVHVTFRHGHRTEVVKTQFQDDPYTNVTVFPIGIGGLTNEGKVAAYNLGKFLRKRYGFFLGNVYEPGLISAVSSGVPRSSMTLLVVLAALFPPKNTPLEWNKNLNWQPIPYNELLADDKLLLGSTNTKCSTYHNWFKEFLRTEDATTVLKSYVRLHQYIQENIKGNINPKEFVENIDAILTRKEQNLEPPLWAKEIYFDKDETPIVDLLLATSGNSKLKQLTGGFLLKKILKDTRLKLKQALQPPNLKMFLYGAHDVTVFYLLNALEVLIPHAPEYTACVVVEVHKINNVDSVRILYRSLTDLKILIVPGCLEFCPFEKFFQLVEKNIPSDEFCELHKSCC